MVKCLPTMRRTRVQSLGREDLLEKEMETHSSILAWKIPWTEEPVGYSPWSRKESDTTEQLHFLSFYCKKHQPRVHAIASLISKHSHSTAFTIAHFHPQALLHAFFLTLILPKLLSRPLTMPNLCSQKFLLQPS